MPDRLPEVTNVTYVTLLCGVVPALDWINLYKLAKNLAVHSNDFFNWWTGHSTDG